MRLIRRHWKLTLIHALVLVMCGAGFLGYMAASKPRASAASAESASAQPADRSSEQDAMDVATYRQVQRLRQRLALTDVDLAAMGCTQGSAEGILRKLVDWTRLNAGAVQRQQAGRLAARRALNEAVRRINVGPKDPSLLSSLGRLKEAVASAKAAGEQLEASAAQAVGTLLDSAQHQVWTVARANADLPAQWRFVPMSRQEGLRLKQALRKGKPASDFLDGSGRQAAQTVWARVNEHMEPVQKAVERVLPVPAEMRMASVETAVPGR